MGRRKDIDWAEVDWALPNYTIAERLGVTPHTVSLRRAKIGLPRKGSPHRCNKSGERYTGVRWSEWTDRALAEVLGVTKQAVNYARKRYGT